MNAIEIQGLTRVYKSYKKAEGVKNSLRGFFNRQVIEKVALSPTTLTIPEGQIVGLVGANGAGKTTLLKILSGLIHPSAGEAKVLGAIPWERDNDFLRQISILLGQKNQLWWDLPASDSFALLADIYDIDLKVARKRVADLSEIMECSELLHVQLRRLSLGERMKMEIIGSLLHKPRVLFLDEPTIGLDIIAQTKIRDFLKAYSALEKPTIILTSHYMDDISLLASRLLLLSRGALVFDGNLDEFTAKATTRQTWILRFSKPLTTPIQVGKIRLDVGALEFEGEASESEISPLLTLILNQTHLREIKIEEVDFESVIREFLQKESSLR